MDAPQAAQAVTKKKKKGKQKLTTVLEDTTLNGSAGKAQPGIKHKVCPSRGEGKASVKSLPVAATGEGGTGKKVQVEVKSGCLPARPAGKGEQAGARKGVAKRERAVRQAAKASRRAFANAVQTSTDVVVGKKRSAPDKGGASKQQRIGN